MLIIQQLPTFPPPNHPLLTIPKTFLAWSQICNNLYRFLKLNTLLFKLQAKTNLIVRLNEEIKKYKLLIAPHHEVGSEEVEEIF